jgi:hypothetical protein
VEQIKRRTASAVLAMATDLQIAIGRRDMPLRVSKIEAGFFEQKTLPSDNFSHLFPAAGNRMFIP